MICPDCNKGMVPALVQKREAPMRVSGATPLRHPEVYAKKIPCPRCNGSGIAYCCDGEDYNAECNTSSGLGNRSGAGEDRPMVA